MRDTFLWIHRWLGLTAGIVFGIASLTGAILVYEHELDAWINAGRFETTPGLMAPSAVDAAIKNAAGSDAAVRTVRWPTHREPAFRVDVESAQGRRTIWLDPGSGAEIQPGRRIPIIPAIRRTHTQLFAGRPGHWVVLISSCFALVSIATGIVVWWPGLKRFWRGFLIRPHRGTYILNYDLHQSLGMIFLPLLLLLTLTGVLIPYGNVARGMARLVLPEGDAPRGWPQVRSEAPMGTPAELSIDGLILTAHRMIGPDADPESVQYPNSPDGVVDVRMRTGLEFAVGSVTRVLVDQYSGEVLQVRDPRTLDRAVRFGNNDVFNLHVGAVGGPIVRILWCIACVVGFVMLPTGIVVWWMKRTRKAISAQQRAARLGPRALSEA